MAALTQTDGRVVGAFAVTEQTLTASDTLTFTPARKQLLVLRNDTAGSLTATIDGDGGTTVSLPAVAIAPVAAGLGAGVAAGAVGVAVGVATGVATAGSVVIEEVVAGACAGDRSLGL